MCTSKQTVSVTGAFLGSTQCPLPVQDVPSVTYNSAVSMNEGAGVCDPWSHDQLCHLRACKERR